MPFHDARQHKDLTDEQLAKGRSTKAFVPGLKQCDTQGCYYHSRNKETVDHHNKKVAHLSCPISGCTESYSSPQKDVHLWKSHQIPPKVETGPLKCRFVGCEWSTGTHNKRTKHEDEMHVLCDVDGCDFRGTRMLFLKHERMYHEPDDERTKHPVFWTPAEDAILDFLWLKHQSFNDVLDIIVEIFPHRCGPGGSPLQAITTHLRKHKSRYEAMDMSLKGEAIVERLKELGLLDDLEQADLDKIGGPSRRSIA